MNLRRCGIGVFLVVFVCASARSQNLLLEDYRVPVSSATSWRANLDFRYKRVGGSESENRGTFFTDYRYFYDSLRFAYSADLRISADKATRNEFVALFSNESVKAYILKGYNLFVGGDFRRQFGSESEATAFAAATAGYGRFINVTPLAKAVRMEDWLLELDQLTDDLPAETMIALAQTIQRESEFRDRFGETYRQHWFEAMEEIVRQSGMMKHDRLEAMALLRMQEVLTRERIFDRFIGWEVKVGTSVDILQSPGAEHPVEVTFRFAKPIGWHVQWNERALATSFLGEDFGDRLTVNIDSDVSYELSDRIDLLVSHALTARRSRSSSHAATNAFVTSFSHRLQGSFVYFIENALTLNLNGVLDSAEGKTRQSVSLTLGFRFL